MYSVLRSFSRTKTNARLRLVENVVQRQYRMNTEKSNLIKVHVVGSGSFGDPAALIVRTSDHSINLFNCGEGTFRLLYARAHRFKHLSNVFCTSNRWERVGGVPSLARAIYDRNYNFPVFHGPPQLGQCLDRFAALTDLDPENAVRDSSFNKETFYDDFQIQVDFVNLHGINVPTDKETVVAYVCRLKPRPGSVILSKLNEFNLSIEQIKAINAGTDVNLSDGTVLHAKDLMSTGFEGGNFLIIDVPSKEYLPDLERNELLNGHIDEINSNIGMSFVAHFASSDIIEAPEYQKFMRRTNAKKHLALNEANMYSGFRQIHSMQHTLNQLDANMYPRLCSKVNPSRQTFTNLDPMDRDISLSEPVCIEPTVSGTRYMFSLNGVFSKKQIAGSFRNNTDAYTDADADDDEFSDSNSEEIETDEDTEVQTITTTRITAFPKIVFLGTGSSFPGVTKTATSILVHTTPDTSIMLDCGEGTVGQICRFYGSRTENIIQNIKALHITHMHGDHHMGLMDLVRIRQKYMPVNRPPLLLMAPKEPFKALLDFYEKHFGDVRNEFKLIDNEDLINGLSDDLKAALKVNHLQTCEVPHLPKSYAISISVQQPDQQEDFKLTFSGDTIPCDSLIELGRNSTLLIHEATLEDLLANSAATKMHSTISQAIEQGEKMAAKYTLLTHFSQRYPVLPPIKDELIKNKNIGIALDNMEVTPDDLSKLNELYFKLKETYADELKRMEKRSQRYLRRSDVMISNLE